MLCSDFFFSQPLCNFLCSLPCTCFSQHPKKVMEKHSVPTLERMLEYMYTNRVEHLKECSAHEVRKNAEESKKQ